MSRKLATGGSLDMMLVLDVGACRRGLRKEGISLPWTGIRL